MATDHMWSALSATILGALLAKGGSQFPLQWLRQGRVSGEREKMGKEAGEVWGVCKRG